MAYTIVPVVRADEHISVTTATMFVSSTPEKDDREIRLHAFLSRYNSPLAQEARVFIREADKHDLDWKLVPAIAGVESTFGRFIPPGSYNAWGWGIPTDAQSGITFSSFSEGIHVVSEGLKTNYIGKGAQTLEQIGAIYADSNAWSNHVRFFIDAIDAYTPNSPQFLAFTID